VPPCDRGRIGPITEAWIKWGKGTRIPVMEHLESLFPGLSGSGCVVTSPEDVHYNCVAWAAEDMDRWWWPDEDSYWPEGVAREETIAAFVAAIVNQDLGRAKVSSLKRATRRSQSMRRRTAFPPISQNNSDPASRAVNSVSCRMSSID
jgi:hypothetical protein